MISRKSFLLGSASGLAALPGLGASGNAGRPRQNLSTKDMKFQGTPFKGRVSWTKGPLAGVIVTNGRDCVKTDRNGRYELQEYPEARFVSVTVPSGFDCEYWYRDCWQRLGGFDFYLNACARTAADRPCRFVHISDSEIHSARGQAWIGDLRNLADREDCAFIVHTGDICGRDGLVAHQKVMNELTMGRKVVYTAGNHDLVSSFPWGEAEFESLYGPCWHSFDACGVHFIVTPMVGGSDRPYGYSNDQVADWMRADLALVDPKTPVVVFSHYLCNFSNPSKSGRVYGRDRELDLRKACNFKAFCYGHTHDHWFTRRDGVAMVNASNPNFAGIDHSPNGARVVTVPKDGPVTGKTFYGDYTPFKSERAGAIWETKLESGVLFGGLLDGGDRLFCAVSDDDGLGTGAVCALDKRTGKVLWRAAVGNTIKGRLALAAGNVIGTDVDGVVYAFEAKDGRAVWKVCLCGNPADLVPEQAAGVAASPDGTRVAVGEGRRAAVLEAATGKVVWKGGGYEAGEPMAVTPAYTDGRIVRLSNWGPMVCNDAATGKLLWTRQGFGFPGGSPVVRSGKVICCSDSRLAEIDLKTGEVLRSAEPVKGGDFGCPGDLVKTADLYLKGTKNSGLVAVDRKTLKVVWTGECGASQVGCASYRGRGTKCVPTTPVVLPDGKTVCAGGADGVIHFWRLKDGKLLRSIKTGAPYLGDLVVSGGTVYAADLAGFVRAFESVG